MSNALATWSEEETRIISSQICPGASRMELNHFAQVCSRYDLDPFRRQIYGAFLKKRNPKTKSYELSLQPLVSIDGLRIIADRSGLYEGQIGPFWCGKDGVWRDSWVASEPPLASRVGVYRKGFKEVIWGTVRLSSFKKDTHIWRTMPDLMLAKCAESNALRRAFPDHVSGLYSQEEMSLSENEEIVMGEIVAGEIDEGVPEPPPSPGEAQKEKPKEEVKKKKSSPEKPEAETEVEDDDAPPSSTPAQKRCWAEVKEIREKEGISKDKFFEILTDWVTEDEKFCPSKIDAQGVVVPDLGACKAPDIKRIKNRLVIWAGEKSLPEDLDWSVSF